MNRRTLAVWVASTLTGFVAHQRRWFRPARPGVVTVRTAGELACALANPGVTHILIPPNTHLALPIGTTDRYIHDSLESVVGRRRGVVIQTSAHPLVPTLCPDERCLVAGLQLEYVAGARVVELSGRPASAWKGNA